MPRYAQPSFAGGELSPSLYGRHDIAKYAVGAKSLRNMIVEPHGSTSNRPGTVFIAEGLGEGKLIPFEFNTEQAYVLEFTDLKMRIIRNGGLVVYPVGHPSEGQIVEIVSPYTLADLARLGFTQSADTMWLTHPNHRPQKLTRTDHHLWTFANVVPDAPVAGFSISSTSWSGTAGSDRTMKYRIGMVKDGIEHQPTAVASQAIPKVWTLGDYITVQWPAQSGATSYNVYKNSRGSWGYIGEVRDDGGALTFIDDNIEPDIGFGARAEPLEDFDAAGDYPGSVALFEQRLIFARTDNQPNTIYASRTGALDDFSVSEVLRDDDAFFARPATGRVDEVRHLLPFDGLLIFTGGAEWVLDASGGIAPSNLNFTVQSYHGCSEIIKPLVVGRSALYVQRAGRIIRDIFYDDGYKGYSGNDMTILSRHIFEESPMVDWTYATEPDSLVWCVREDGKMPVFTYHKEHEVYAWSVCETNGEYEAVASIPSATGGNDEVYFIVKREINGSTVRHLEQLSTRVRDNLTSNYLDSALIYSGAPATVFSGLDHLEGETVNALADGNVIENLTVTGGQVTLDNAASDVLIGLPYISEIVTMEPVVDTDRGTSHGMMSTIQNVHIHLRESRGVLCGPTTDGLYEIPFRGFEDYNEATQPFSGIKRISITPVNTRNASLVIRQVYPLPMTVLGASMEFSVGG